jgi:hypothetical protein
MLKIIATTVGAMVIALQPTVSFSQETVPSPITFFCDQTVEPPTTFANLPGETNPTPFLSWYSEYLLPEDSAVELCQQVAEKLQVKSERGESYVLAAQELEDRWTVCLLASEEEDCQTSASEELFSLNNLYRQTPKCLTENKEPKFCTVRTLIRGSLLSIPSSSYTPTWWPFK